MRALLDRVAGRVRLMVGRCILEAINPGTKLQSVQIQVLAGEVRDNVEHFQPYGYSSVPHPGAEGISLAVGGSSDHKVVICIDDRRYRLTSLQEGEVALYTDEGDKVVLKRGRNIEVTAGTKVTLITPLTVLTGDLDVGGSVTVDGQVNVAGDVTGVGTSLHGHTHMDQGDFAPVSPPL
jgi:phage baseplate assembly protein V